MSRTVFAAVVVSVLHLSLPVPYTSAQSVEPWRVKLYEQWKQLPEPPVTPYDGPFGGNARGFVVDGLKYARDNKGKLTPEQVANLTAIHDYHHTAKNGVYDPKKDPRPINTEYETAVLADWDRMGYNCAYKGGSFTFMVGSFLKEKGLLGAIDDIIKLRRKSKGLTIAQKLTLQVVVGLAVAVGLWSFLRQTLPFWS